MKRLLLVPLAGCLSVPSGAPPMCTTTADCDADAGEVCDQGVCWGNPPIGPFAAVVSPPAERHGDLVSSELEVVPISSDGWLDDLWLRAPVTYKGRLQALCEAPMVCDSRTLGATITITRPSGFAGGPGFRSVVTVQPGDPSFELELPATSAHDVAYTMTVVPEGRDSAAPLEVTTAQLVPPLRTELRVPASVGGKIIELGGLTLTRIGGMVTTSTGAPLDGYRVVALGHWDPDQPPSEVSTVAYTGTDGKYSLSLSADLVDYVEIVAKPYGPLLRPTLRLGNVLPGQDASNKTLVMPPEIGNAVTVDVVVEGVENGGEVRTVPGARVAVTSAVTTGTNATATLVAEATTNDAGIARLKLLDGAQVAASYRLSIVPPASAKAGAMFDEPYAIATATTKRLATRVALRGVVHDIDGNPVKDVAVTVRPALRFLWSLPAAPQAFVAAIPPAIATTPNTGEFVLFVDPQFTNVWGHYDLVFEPTSSGTQLARTPSWSQPIELPRDATRTTVTLPTITLPDASYVRGQVFDDMGALLEGAEVKLYRVETDLTLCDEVRYEPQRCPIPAQLMGRGSSNDSGRVALTLPR